MRNNGPVTASPRSSRDVVSPPQTANLADLLERVLDKGIVIAGDITLFLGGVQLLTLRIRLLVASIDKAQELGINWWQSDPALSSRASARAKELDQERDLLKKRLDRLERLLLPPPAEADKERAEAGQRSNAAPAYVLDKNGKVSAELKQPVQPAEQQQEDEGSQIQERAPQLEATQAERPAGAGPLLDPALHERITQAWQRMEQARPEGRQEEDQQQEEEQPQALERPSQPEAAQAEQPAGAGPLLGQALHERIAQAMRPVLEGLPQWIAQAWQPGEQARPEE
jgi:hypothetical protein